MLKFLAKIFHRHDYQPFLLPNGHLSKQYKKCFECGNIKERCNHNWSEPFDYLPTSIKCDELEGFKYSFTVKNVKQCTKCAKIDIIYSHQW